MSLRAVATELNEAGMLTQRGNLWKASVLRRTFMNPLMAGFVILDDGTPGLCAGLTEGIVTAERWAEFETAHQQSGASNNIPPPINNTLER